MSRFLDEGRPARYFTILPSPLGELLLAGDGEALTHLSFEAGDGTHDVPDGMLAVGVPARVRHPHSRPARPDPPEGTGSQP